MMVTNKEMYYKRGLQFRTHGITRDFKEREKINTHYYEMQDLGFNYRIPDVLCALGSSQLARLDQFVSRRNEIADQYNRIFSNHLDKVEPFEVKGNTKSAYHIYVVKLKNVDRDDIFRKLKEVGIGVNVHYMPIYLHPYYLSLGYTKGLCSVAENIYSQIITLPMFPLLKDTEVEYICNKLISLM